ncbi:carbohydrate-binding protein [Aquimarina sp. 2201CG14-23]|uniref:carbohydrate-binding protein n=1 Tax=Aquimarina mycalae TaxID=3040073 RepID=UPI002477CE68|nr:carbohydrate-binding protein [Aquimarina sp. 2201CG14-23]MDH7444456.1 carbohydrate-binding protein [Aquimarina sp. 2201CG14-23]
MKKNTNQLVVLLLFFVTINVFAQPTPPQGKKWERVEALSDEFNGNALDFSKWDDQSPEWRGRVPGIFKENTIKVKEGNLQITNYKLPSPEGAYTHAGGLVRSLKSQTYGYYECKMKASRTFMSSTFWLFNKRNEGSGCDVRTTELDITETVGVNSNGANWVNNTIRNMNSNTHSRGTTCNSTPVGQKGNKAPLGEESWKNYHTYGAWWKSKSEVLFYLDGKFVGQIKPPADFNLPMYLRLVTETYDWNPVPPDGGMNGSADSRTTYYDWVRSYRLVDDNNPNIAPTVELLSPINGTSFDIGKTIPLSANASDTDGTIAKVEFFINNSLAATEQVIPYETSTTIANVGNYTIIAKATDNDGAVTTSQSVNITVEDNSVPPTDVINIPGSFEAEDFELKSGSVRIENTPGTASDKNLGYIRNGDFANYSVNVDANSEYTFDVYASSKGVGGTIDILEFGSVVGSINIPVTGQWHNYKKYTTTVSLSSGEKTLRLLFKGASGYLYNIDKIETKKIQPVEQTVTLSPIHDAFLQGSSRNNSNMIRIELNRRTGYLMFDLSSINGTITKADLQFTIFSDAGNGNITIHKGNNNNWTETNLSNANKPGKGSQLGTLNANFPIGSVKTIPLKISQISGNKLSLILNALSGNDFAFASKENGSVAAPKLIITYTSSRDNDTNQDDVKIFPNPVTNFITFSRDMTGKKIKVFNTTGILVQEIVLTTDRNTVDMSNLPSGYYIINVLDTSKANKIITTKKVIKQ